MIKRQLKDLLTCIIAGLFGGEFGFVCGGFYDYQGQIYFDLAYGIRGALFCGAMAYIIALAYKISQYYNKGENND